MPQSPRRRREYYTENREQMLKDHARRYADNPEAGKLRSRRWRATKKYGIPLGLFGLVEVLQREGICWICGKSPDPKRRHHLDHDHETGEFRGVLCHKCNHLLGHASDDPEILRKAIGYLQSPPGAAELTKTPVTV